MPPVNLQWTVATPPITFGTVRPLPISARSVSENSGLNMETTSPNDRQAAVGLSGPGSPQPQYVPSVEEAEADFDAMVEQMVEKVMTCSICSAPGHLSSSCPTKRKCTACYHVGHWRRKCKDFAVENGLVWRAKKSQLRQSFCKQPPDTSCSTNIPSASVQSHCASAANLSPPPLPFAPRPATPPPPPALPSPERQPSMANFKLDPHRYLPVGHHIIDGGELRLPRTFVTPVCPVRTPMKLSAWLK